MRRFSWDYAKSIDSIRCALSCDKSGGFGQQEVAASFGALSRTAFADKQIAMIMSVAVEPSISRRDKLPASAAGTLHDCEHCSIRPASVCSALTHADLGRFESRTAGDLARRATLFSEGQPAEAVYNVTAGSPVSRGPRGRLPPSGGSAFQATPGLPADGRYSFSADASEVMTACRFPDNHFRRSWMNGLISCGASAIDDQKPRSRPGSNASSGAPTRNQVAAFLINMRERWSCIRAVSATVSLPMVARTSATSWGWVLLP